MLAPGLLELRGKGSSAKACREDIPGYHSSILKPHAGGSLLDSNGCLVNSRDAFGSRFR